MMGLGELAGLAGILLAVLAILNEHDRRIWLAPWRPWLAWVPAAISVGLLTYLVTYPVWEGLDRKIFGLPFVSQWLVACFEKRQWMLDAKDWASALALLMGLIAGLWTWLSPLRAWKAVDVLEERRIASDDKYIQSKLAGMLASAWPFSYWFQSRLASLFPSFLTDPRILRHFLEFDFKPLIHIMNSIGKPNRLELAAATMQVLAGQRTKAIDCALWNMYENDTSQFSEADLFNAMGNPDPESLWERIHETTSTKSVGNGAWGSNLAFNGKTNFDILDTYAGRLGVSWIWLARCSVLSNAFKDSSLEGYACSAVSMILKDLNGCQPIATSGSADMDGSVRGMIDPLRKTPGTRVRAAQIVTEWFLDEWIKRARQAEAGENRRLTLGSLFQLYRQILSASSLDPLERQAMLTSSINQLCAIHLSHDDLRNFNDGLTPSSRSLLAHWLQSEWYWDFGRTGDTQYLQRLQTLQDRYPFPGYSAT
jgi:hypothetical protein